MIDDDQAQHYLFELVRETELVERLHRRFLAAAETWLKVDHAQDPDGRMLWTGTVAEREMQEAVEGILAGFARISLFLFPSGSAGSFGRERGERLRALTGIGINHPIGDRELRNHWMHLDERFDTFVQQHGSAPVGYYLQREHRVSASSKAEMLRLLDPAAEKVFVLGTEYRLRELADAAEHVGQQAAIAILDLARSDTQ